MFPVLVGSEGLGRKLDHAKLLDFQCLSTAMACQHSTFIVSGSLEIRLRQGGSIVTESIHFPSFAAMCIMMGVTGIFGIWTDEGNVLNNFPSKFDRGQCRGVRC
jgi:hypothetical protein